MSTYHSIAWLPLCAGLTAAGLALTCIVARRRGWRVMLRGAAWSLLPIAAYLTGSVEMLWKIGTAIGNFATAFAFSSEKWAGIGVVGLAAVLFLASGGRARRKASRDRATVPGRAAAQTAVEVAKTEPVKLEPGGKRAAKPAADDDLKDVEEILRKRGL